MAWQEPKTDWSAADHVTHSDMNRITGNLNVVYPAGRLKTDYTQNDIVTETEWQQILTSLQAMMATTGISGELPGTEMTAETFNQLEELTQEIYDQIQFLLDQTKASVYSGDLVYAADTYAAGY